HVGAALTHHGEELRRKTARIEQVAARIFQRQRQAEGAALAHFRDALFHLLRCDPVDASQPVVRPEVTPVRPFRPVFPALRHSCRLPPITKQKQSLTPPARAWRRRNSSSSGLPPPHAVPASGPWRRPPRPPGRSGRSAP